MNENKHIKCVKCDYTLTNDDYFCPKCGEITAEGYIFYQKSMNLEKIKRGYVYKQERKLKFFMFLLCFTFISFVLMMNYRGKSMFKPYFDLKKEIYSYIYGYKSTILITDNNYSNVNVNSLETSKLLIKNDFNNQKWQCSNRKDVSKIEYNLENDLEILSVSFCDMDYEEASKIDKVIREIYDLFPSIKGGLTNLSISNAKELNEYIAYFQPSYIFVNDNEDISNSGKVHKTQILLNSYYFLNEKILDKGVTSVVTPEWYVKDATFESSIAHELGHYISFYSLLKQYGINNIYYENSKNSKIIEEIINKFDDGSYSNEILDTAINNYNEKYNLSISKDEFTKNISKYAGAKDAQGVLIAEETIAEAFHDYYLHRENAQNESKEIIGVIRGRL